jgi:hypothetical protein
MKQASPFDLSVGFFMLVSVTTAVIAGSLLAIRGKSKRSVRGGRCSLLRAVLACGRKPEIVARAALSLPEFHPAKHAAANLKPQVFTNSRYYSREKKDSPTVESRVPASPLAAAEILLEAERHAVQAAATHVNKELHSQWEASSTQCEHKPIRPDPAPDPAAMELEVTSK